MSADTDRILDKLDEFGKWQRQTDAVLATMNAKLDVAVELDERVNELERDKDRRDGAASEARKSRKPRRETLVVAGAGTGALSGLAALLERLFG